VDEPWTLIDPQTLEVIVPEPALEADWTALDDLPKPRSSKAEAAPGEPGRYRLASWYVWVDPESPFGKAQQAAEVLSSVAVAPSELPATFDRLSDVLERVPVKTLWMHWLDQLDRDFGRRR
jgi:hypothetical protein